MTPAKMKPAKLIEFIIKERVYDLRELLSKKPEIFIGKRDPNSLSIQADIILGEDEKGKLNVAPFMLKGISSKQARITYEEETYYIQDCSTKGTTGINDKLLSKGEKRALETSVSLSFGTFYGLMRFELEN